MTAIDPGLRPPRDTVEILWEGKPGWWPAAVHVWHIRAVGFYFLLLMVNEAYRIWSGVAPRSAALADSAHLLGIAILASCLLLGLGAMTARTTRYSINDRALEMRIGIALQARLVIPLAAIAHVSVRARRDGTGDLAVQLKPGQSVIYPKLWPHARPWHLLRAEPMLRAIDAPGVPGAILCRAIAAFNEERARFATGGGISLAENSAPGRAL
jgi:hypothetical protein